MLEDLNEKRKGIDVFFFFFLLLREDIYIHLQVWTHDAENVALKIQMGHSA